MSLVKQNSLIKEKIVNILYDIKIIKGLYKISINKNELLKESDWKSGVYLKWINDNSLDVGLNILMSLEGTTMITYNIINSLINDKLKKEFKIKNTKLNLQIVDIEKG